MIQSIVLFAALLAASDSDASSAIKTMNDSYVAAMIAGDAHTVASHFEADALMISKNKSVQGRDTIEAYLTAALAKGHPATGTCATSHLDVDGNKAFETGSCSFDFGGGYKYNYHYLALWHHQSDGTWLLATDVSE